MALIISSFPIAICVEEEIRGQSSKGVKGIWGSNTL